MKASFFDSIECVCGARTVVGNLGKKGQPISFVGGSHKGDRVKHSINANSHSRIVCLWCGRESHISLPGRDSSPAPVMFKHGGE